MLSEPAIFRHLTAVKDLSSMKNRLALFALLAASTCAFAGSPSIDSVAGDVILDFTVPVGKTLVIPLEASDPDGQPLGFTVESTNPNIVARVRNGYADLKLDVSQYVKITGTFITTGTTIVSGTAVITTSTNTRVTGTSIVPMGSMDMLLFRDLTPKTSAIISGLAQSGFYDNLKFHRVVSEFAIQGGDPNGNGFGGPGFSFENEFHPGLIFTGFGQLAMAHSGWNRKTLDATNGSQFFITLGSPRFLDFNHTIYGQISRGYNTLLAIESVPVHSETPDDDVVMTGVSVVPNSTDACLFVTASGTGSATITVLATNGVSESSSVDISVEAVKDTLNNSPVLNYVDDTVAGWWTPAVVKLTSFDLEQDPRLYNVTQTGTPHAFTMALGYGDTFGIWPWPYTYFGPSNLAFGVAQTGTFSRGTSASPYDLQTITVGMYDAAIAAQPTVITASVGEVLLSATVAKLKDSDVFGTKKDFTATINWGDDTITTGSAVQILGGATNYVITGSHAYSAAGTYPILVKITGNLGAVDDVMSTAVISEGDVFLTAETIAVSGTLFSGTVARFTDALPDSVDSYTAAIQWGDGGLSSIFDTVITSTGTDSFVITATHAYLENGTYPLTVTLWKTSEPDPFTGWGLANVSQNAATSFPPLARGNLVPRWLSLTTYFSTAPHLLTGILEVTNWGTLPVSSGTLSFYRSANATLETGTDVRLTLANGANSLAIPALNPGERKYYVMTWYPGYTSPLVVTGTGSQAGQYLLNVMDFNDPIGDQLPISKVTPVIIPKP